MPKPLPRPIFSRSVLPKPALSRSQTEWKSPKVIGIVGSRRRDTSADNDLMIEAFDRVYQEGDTVVSGGCPKGGDKFAEYLARDRGLTITIHHANWRKHGKAAGPIRNTLIAQDCDILIALCAPDRTGGTEDTVRKALKLGKEVVYA